MERIILDTDLGMGAPGSDIDDGFALALAHADPDMAIDLITTVNGNTDVETATALTLNLVRRLGVDALTESGHLARVHGRGTFVLPPDLEQPLAHEMIGIGDAFDRQGVKYTTEVVSLDRVSPPARIAQLLDSPNQNVLRLERRRSVADEPVVLLHNYVRTDRTPNLETHDFSQERLFAAIETELGEPIGTARRTFQAQPASTDVARALAIPAGAAVLYLEQITYLRTGEPVEYSDVWIRGDRMKLTALLQRPAQLGRV